MNPTDKEHLFNELSTLYEQKDFKTLLTKAEENTSKKKAKDELSYYIYLYIIKASYELSRYNETLAYIPLAMHYKHNYVFDDKILNNDKTGIYFWELEEKIAKSKEGKYGMLKVQKKYEAWTSKTQPNINTPTLLSEMRLWFEKKVIKRLYAFLIIPIALMAIVFFLFMLNITFDFINYDYDYKSIQKIYWRYFFTVVSPFAFYEAFKKYLHPLTDQLMLFWIRAFKKDMMQPF